FIFLAEKSKNIQHQISGAINLAKLYQTINKHETVLKIVDDALKFQYISSHHKTLLQNIKTSSLVALNTYDDTTVLNATLPDLKFNTYKNSYIIELKKENYASALSFFKKAKEHIQQADLSSRD